ncbi:hypothetical protein D9M72_589350 [compost metagenome]
MDNACRNEPENSDEGIMTVSVIAAASANEPIFFRGIPRKTAVAMAKPISAADVAGLVIASTVTTMTTRPLLATQRKSRMPHLIA